jgi:hypothetical protein
MIKLALQARDQLIVMCKKEDCPKFECKITFSDYFKHIDQCGDKSFYCP